jgi:hypothetical protein
VLRFWGPGLNDPNVPFSIPQGMGATRFDTHAAKPHFFHEPFTGTDSWILATQTVTLPNGGRFYVVAFDPNQQSGKLWIAIGKKEKFGLTDWLGFGRIKKLVRQFHEVDKDSRTPDPNS